VALSSYFEVAYLDLKSLPMGIPEEACPARSSSMWAEDQCDGQRDKQRDRFFDNSAVTYPQMRGSQRNITSPKMFLQGIRQGEQEEAEVMLKGEKKK